MIISPLDYFLGLQATGYWCFIAMDRMDPFNTTATCLIVASIIATILILVICHVLLVSSYMSWNRARAQKARIGKKKAEEKRELEWRLVKKSIAISFFFSLSCVFFIIQAGIELSSGMVSSPVLGSLVVMAGLLSPIVNVFILYVYDPKFKQNVRQVLLFDYIWGLCLAIFKTTPAAAAAAVELVKVVQIAPALTNNHEIATCSAADAATTVKMAHDQTMPPDENMQEMSTVKLQS